MMREPGELVRELWYCDPSTHIFCDIRTVKKSLDSRTLGIYGSRLDAANLKIRYASEQYLRFCKILKSLEHGEFIYFDDENRIAAYSAFEAFLIFQRASLDLVTAAWWAYHTNSPNLDSFHDFLKKLDKNLSFWDQLSSLSQQYWSETLSQFKSSDFNWLNALVGADRGQSLRDIAVHRNVVDIDTAIDYRDRGYFYIALDKNTTGPALPWAAEIFETTIKTINRMIYDIDFAESQLIEEV